MDKDNTNRIMDPLVGDLFPDGIPAEGFYPIYHGYGRSGKSWFQNMYEAARKNGYKLVMNLEQNAEDVKARNESVRKKR